ncbi:TPA: restriction endonuclease subunit S [Bacillus paranthracis]|uniref:restriction endonuclease subunit S n=1 Tax=Bacillus mycoides TaxID=1405 RepID=UPI001FB22034|nr:restriction endonuclease subunit S [Bacillus mycoides]UNP82558.1 restriction endonuclease subunit S [Bacillus mycoides]
MRYQQYQDSGIGWIGDIPAHWQGKPLFSLFDEVKAKNVGNIEKNVLSLSYGSIVRRDVDSNYGLLPDSFESYNQIKKGDIVLRLTDLQNDKKSLRCGYVKEDGIITSAYVTIRKSTHILNNEYYYYLLHAYDIKKIFYNLGAGVRQSMGYRDLKKLSVLLPPSEEQLQIVEFLNKSIPHIDLLIKQKEALIKLLEEKRQSMITEAVTKGLNPNVKMKDSGVEWIGEIPEHWTIKKIKHISNLVGSGKTPKGGSEIYPESGVLFLRSMNVHYDGIRLKDIVHITPEIDEDMRSTRVKAKDVLLNITGASIGRSCIVPESLGKANVNQHVCIIRSKTRVIVPELLSKIMSSNFIMQQILMSQNGSSREGLNFSQVKNLKFPLVRDLNEQIEIANYISVETDKVNNLVNMIKQQSQKLKEYRQSLIYEAVTGKIDVREFELEA